MIHYLRQDIPGYPAFDSAGHPIRKYSRQACEALGQGKGNIWHANGECVPILAPDGKKYNASLVCAGLNDITTSDITLNISTLDYDCPEKEESTGWILLSLFSGIFLGLLASRYYARFSKIET